MSRAAVFLDRDGVLIERVVSSSGTGAARSLGDVVLTVGAIEACQRLRSAGYALVMVTNQPDVARGAAQRSDVDAINRALRDRLNLDDVRACYHDDVDHCECRKPLPGLLVDAARELDLDLTRSIMIGDRWRDVGAGRAAGCRTVLVDEVLEEQRLEPDHRCGSLPEAVRWIVAQPTSRTLGEDMADINPSSLGVKLFADGADLEGLQAVASDQRISGFTTNPTLMRKAGITDYEEFARQALRIVGERPISFEVFADDVDEMKQQALEISSWGPNIYVKIPITTTDGHSTAALLADLAGDGVAVNVTALLTLDQVSSAAAALSSASHAIISVFAGRYADTGRDPVPMMREAAAIAHAYSGIELLWASPRELLNVLHARQAGCDIITVSNDLLAKLPLLGKDLREYSLETVRMFYDDAARAGYRIRLAARTTRRN